MIYINTSSTFCIFKHYCIITEKITPGLRVVLPDYAVGDDNKEYAWNLGTICDIDKAGQVFVKWDVLDKKELKTFKKRDNNQYTLLLYDNTKAGMHFFLVEYNAYIYRHFKPF